MIKITDTPIASNSALDESLIFCPSCNGYDDDLQYINTTASSYHNYRNNNYYCEYCNTEFSILKEDND